MCLKRSINNERSEKGYAPKAYENIVYTKIEKQHAQGTTKTSHRNFTSCVCVCTEEKHKFYVFVRSSYSVFNIHALPFGYCLKIHEQ